MFKYSLENFSQNVQKPEPRWVGFDLDGTLAKYDTWRGWDYVGEPIPAMVKIVKDLMAKGITCKVLTARASKVSLAKNNIQFSQLEKVIQDWTEKHIGIRMEVVSEKDYLLVSFYDDKCVQVEMNTGSVIGKDITLDEYNKKNGIQAYKEPVEVEIAEVDKQENWNENQVKQDKIDLFRAGIVDGGYKSADYPESWSNDAQWLVDGTADNTIIRVALNTVKGQKNGVDDWYLVCDVNVAAGSNRLAFVLDDSTDFRAIGQIIAKRTLSKVGVTL